ncbi:MAG: energy transducer TonB [Acidobacteria bacterium]|nr:energy transducer TonB [Acidobacteriota bacterium]MBV9070633.1 energy transducer TonB [Acidobacteriota bacterium]MBV9478180.1 energy transducer TonB [Acidobacteriota bacterium]
MFETSVIRAQAAAARGRVPLLGISIVAHSAVVIGAVAVSIASVSFPMHAPKEFARAPLLMQVSVPPPLGNPNAGAPHKPQQPQPAQKPQTPPPTAITAPPQTPATITPAAQPPSTASNDAPATGSGTESGPIGQPWGVAGSLGDLDAPPATSTIPATPPVEERVYRVGEVKAPVLLRRVEPTYPPMFVRAHMPGKVALHCIIDKNGRVRDAQVVFATNSAFADAVLRSLDGWRYTPASLHGEAVDCYLDLSVDFGVH